MQPFPITLFKCVRNDWTTVEPGLRSGLGVVLWLDLLGGGTKNHGLDGIGGASSMGFAATLCVYNIDGAGEASYVGWRLGT